MYCNFSPLYNTERRLQMHQL